MEAFMVERRLEFSSHGFVTNPSGTRTQVWLSLSFFFLSYPLVVNIRHGALLKNNTSHHKGNATHYVLIEETL